MGTRYSKTKRLAVGSLGGIPWLSNRRGSKYRAQPAESFDGRRFASKAERDRYHELQTLLKAGEIKDLVLQPRWHFWINGRYLEINGRKVRYTADFQYYDCRKRQIVVEDVKGYMTRDAALRIALMRAVHGIEVQLLRRKP